MESGHSLILMTFKKNKDFLNKNISVTRTLDTLKMLAETGGYRYWRANQNIT